MDKLESWHESSVSKQPIFKERIESFGSLLQSLVNSSVNLRISRLAKVLNTLPRAVLGIRIQVALADWLLDSTPDLGWSLANSLSGLPVFTCMHRTARLVVHIVAKLHFCKIGRFDSRVMTHKSIYELNYESPLKSYDSSHHSSYHSSHQTT